MPPNNVIKSLSSSPAWLKKQLAEKVLTEKDPAKVRAAQTLIDKIKSSEQMTDNGLTPEQAEAMLRSLSRPQPTYLPPMEQLPIEFKKGGRVSDLWSLLNRAPKEQRRAVNLGEFIEKLQRQQAQRELERNLPPSVVRLSPEQLAAQAKAEEAKKARGIAYSQRNSPSMTDGAARKMRPDDITKALVGAPIIGGLSAMPGSGAGRAAITKLGKMLAEGTRNPALIGGGAAIGAGTELLEDNPTLAGAATNALMGAADVAAPIPTIVGQVLMHSPEAKAGLLTKALQKYGARAARGAVDDTAETLPGQLGVVKEKGGNWLSGSVEDALKGLKQKGIPDKQFYNDRVWAELPEDVRAGITGFGYEKVPQTHPKEWNAAWESLYGKTPQGSLNSWIEGPLTKYVKSRMASPDDEVRKLAEQGVLHVNPESLRYGIRSVHPSGEALEKLAKSPEALRWENAADYGVRSEPASTYQNFGSSNLGLDWVNKLDPNTPFYRVDSAAQDLGFPHLIDELSNALNPASGLPRNLQLSPEAMQQMSMEKAVRRVADINAWRAAQKIEANRQLAEKASLVREYAENNPKGLRWVEIKAETKPTGAESSVDDIADAVKYETSQRKALADQLKYEGEVMGHCVGGYCDDVLSGRSRIFSLRDAKGEPHVTVEVEPQSYVAGDLAKFIGKDEVDRLIDSGMSLKQIAASIEDFKPNISIVQIKGKQNRKPNDEYLPFVQDFVKTPPGGISHWSEVGDLHNTGLTVVPKDSPLAKRLLQENREVPDYMTDAEYDALTTEFGLPKFASGGSVTKDFTSNDLHAIIAALEAGINA